MITNDLITEEDDIVLRGYAKRLDPQQGEDAYHNAICSMLEKPTVIQNIIGLCIVAIRRALYKIFRHEKTERENIEHYINGDPVPAQVGWKRGSVRQEKCRKGLHDLVEGNLVYVGARRTCQACMELRRPTKKSNV